MQKLENILIPLPKEIIQLDQNFTISNFGGKVKIDEAEKSDKISEGKKIICNKMQGIGVVGESDDAKYKIIIKIDSSDEAFKDIESDEAYYIKTGKDESILCGKSDAGAFYAAVTFSEMIYKSGDSICTPGAYILDYPDYKNRGHFFECRYGTEFMTKEDWFSAIDYLAKTKVNRVTIGLYGCWHRQYDGKWAEYLYIPLERYPNVKTPKNIKYYSVLENRWICQMDILPPIYEHDFLCELMAYAKRKNITVRPLFNSLGHNTLLPKCFPECASKDENGKSKTHGFCTKNEKTYELMFSIYDNIIDKYLVPNGIKEFHVGLDEVMDEYKCHCDECRKRTHAELMVEYMIRLCKYLKERGMEKIFIYHDMLYHEFDIVNEELVAKFKAEDIYDEVVLDWWTYEDPAHLFWNKADGVNNLFHSIIKPDTGYYGWVIPTENNENIRACAEIAKKLEFEGIEAYGSYDPCFDKNYLTLADVAWNKDIFDNEEEFNKRYAMHLYGDEAVGAIMAFHSLSDIMKDDSRAHYMNRLSRFFEYYNYSYCREGLPYPQNFPSQAYKKIEDEEEVMLPYLELIKQKSSEALKFFKNNGFTSKINDMWKLTAMQYFADADEYLTLYGIYKAGNISGFGALKELDRLIIQREELMALAERTKNKNNSYTYLRNMTIFRQILLDIKEYLKKEIAGGNNPKLNVTELGNVLSGTLDFLR